MADLGRGAWDGIGNTYIQECKSPGEKQLMGVGRSVRSDWLEKDPEEARSGLKYTRTVIYISNSFKQTDRRRSSYPV